MEPLFSVVINYYYNNVFAEKYQGSSHFFLFWPKLKIAKFPIKCLLVENTENLFQVFNLLRFLLRRFRRDLPILRLPDRATHLSADCATHSSADRNCYAKWRRSKELRRRQTELQRRFLRRHWRLLLLLHLLRWIRLKIK